jgi:hypothetical protein
MQEPFRGKTSFITGIEFGEEVSKVQSIPVKLLGRSAPDARPGQSGTLICSF